MSTYSPLSIRWPLEILVEVAVIRYIGIIDTGKRNNYTCSWACHVCPHLVHLYSLGKNLATFPYWYIHFIPTDANANFVAIKPAPDTICAPTFSNSPSPVRSKFVLPHLGHFVSKAILHYYRPLLPSRRVLNIGSDIHKKTWELLHPLVPLSRSRITSLSGQAMRTTHAEYDKNATL